jgi:acetyl/propionyl-CoA carboxylase alpha subunit
VDGDGAIAVAARVGYPVMVKAVQGGGGIGMQRAADEAALVSAIEMCASRAGAAFADARVYVERALDHARHVEVQVARDAHGRSIAFGDRECSVQRRHQKVLEECRCPAAALSDALRNAMVDGAQRLLDVADYVGVATVEFLFTEKPSPAAHFLEVNARIQVEHPVTEAVYGIDLVELQLTLARGEAIGPDLVERTPSGHAVEVRIYAEDPAKGFLPQPGTLTRLRWPEGHEGIRVDACYREGELITPYYDPLIAKLVAEGADRSTALDRLVQALAATEIAITGPKGPKTSNVEWLRGLLEDPRIVAGEYDTGVVGKG